jgi:ATP phosphoribosyltransferase regulatory subunit
MVLEGYTAGLGFSLLGGGRYDHLLATFGFNCPATGFAFGIERALLALTRQGLRRNVQEKNVYVAFEAGFLKEAIAKVEECRNSGRKAQLALLPQNKHEAQFSAERLGIKELIYIS